MVIINIYVTENMVLQLFYFKLIQETKQKSILVFSTVNYLFNVSPANVNFKTQFINKDLYFMPPVSILDRWANSRRFSSVMYGLETKT